MSEHKPFFILSCARSGSTSLARILDTATNGCCVVEPAPNLNYETRLAMEGRLEDPVGALNRTVVPRVRAGLETFEIYGEKNLTYGPFIRHLHELLGCRFIYQKRDGRDVVRSLMDWHDTMFGSIYRECQDPGDLSPRALAKAATLPVHLDTSDYSRPRPSPADSLYFSWSSLTRFEMCAYYWAKINDLYLDELRQLPGEAWMELDYTSPDVESVLRSAGFLSLLGVERDRVDEMLAGRINSTTDRVGEGRVFPSWPDWDGGLRRQFDAIAGDAMIRLGYRKTTATRWKPPGFAAASPRQLDPDRLAHERQTLTRSRQGAIEWIHARAAAGDRIESVADFGCRLDLGASEALAGVRCIGFDFDQSAIDFHRETDAATRSEYRCFDFELEPASREFDLVISIGTIDSCWDVDVFLDAMIRVARGWIYLTCEQGWLPDLAEHRYSWSERDGSFRNAVSPARIREHLALRNCTGIVIEPTRSDRRDLPSGTRIIARVR